METREFQELVWQKGRELFRPMPWRDDTQPYYVLVSEIMLQQTQVDRVKPKFLAFIAQFPTVEALANAGLDEVVRAWSGLGYNRRAKFLHQAARMIQNEYDGQFPDTAKELVTLPGVGVNTAGALMAYSFNQPEVFIETNIRTVYFHHFFADRFEVKDSELMPIVASTIDTEHPREWYWAMMDYGSFLKKQGIGANSKSAHYKKQAPLKGSVREVRGAIIKRLTGADLTRSELAAALHADGRFPEALAGLVSDGLVQETNGYLHLTR